MSTFDWTGENPGLVLRDGDEGPATTLAGLTRREMEVADLMARGCTNREIATELTVSPETVKAHVRHILRKLDMHYRGGVRELLMDSRWVLD